MSNPVKAVGKTFKKVAKSLKPLVKPLLIGAAIYFGGGAAGLWNTPFTTGAAGGAVAGSTTAGTAAAGGGAATTGASGAAATGAAAGPAGVNTVLSPAASAAAQTGASTASMSVPVAKAGSAMKGAAKTMLGFMKENPVPTYLIGSSLQSAFTPTAAEQQMELEDYRRKNSSYFGVSGGSGGPGSDITGLRSAVQRPIQSDNHSTRGALSRYAR